jgi:hypothetical protein
VLGFVIGVVHGKVKFCAATVAKQATVLGNIRYQTDSLHIYLACLNTEISLYWGNLSVMLFRNCIGALVTRMIAVKYQVLLMLLFCQTQGKVVAYFSVI